MSRALQNRLTHLLTSRSTPSSVQVSQLHNSNVVSQRFWNLLNLENSQKNNAAKREPSSKANCSTTNEMSVGFLKSKPSVGELLSKWCSRRFDDKFHYDKAPQTPYYRHRAPRLPSRPCSQAPFCPTRQPPCPPPPCPEPKPCDQPKPCPSKSCARCKKPTLSCSENPCKGPKPYDPYPEPKTCPPSRPYPSNPCEPCPRRNSCPKPKPCPRPPCPRRPSCPVPLPPPKPSCPGPCDPCRPKPTPMACPIRRCCRNGPKRTMRSNNVPMGTAGGIGMNQLGGKSARRSQMRGFHDGSTMKNNRSNNNSSGKKGYDKRSGKKGKKKRPRKNKTVRSSGLSGGQNFGEPSGKRRHIKSKKDQTSPKPDEK